MADGTTALLIRARALVARGWCRGTGARNFLGFRVNPTSWWASAWCADGALASARLEASDRDLLRARCRLVAAMGNAAIPNFNDRQKTVVPILAAFDGAISAEPV